MSDTHDLGGMKGLGPVSLEADDPLFHEDWEKTVFGLFFGCFAKAPIRCRQVQVRDRDEGGSQDVGASYYEHWSRLIESALIDDGTLTREEIEQRVAQLAGQEKT